MNESGFIICVLVVSFAAHGCIAWYVRQLWIGHMQQTGELQQILTRTVVLERWAGAYVSAQNAAAAEGVARLDSLNGRLVQLETENKITPPAPRDDDPFSGPRSWPAQAIAAEKGAGVHA